MLAGIPIHTAMKLTIDQDKCITAIYVKKPAS